MRVLLVETDTLLRAALVEVLQANDYRVDLVAEEQAGLHRAIAAEYDLILLAGPLSQGDGISLCQQLRSQGYHKPILLLTVDGNDAEVAAGLAAGADDYINQPCAPEVLLARLRIWLRRSGALPAKHAENTSATLTWGLLSLDLDAGRVMVGEQIIALTATEFHLLELFLRHPDRIFSRSAILDRLWEFDDAPSDRAIVTYVKDVRKKLKANGLTEDIIETVYGMGYRLKPAPQSATAKFPTPKTPPRASSPREKSAVEHVLERFRGSFKQQVEVLEQARTALLTGNLTADLQHSAHQIAHKLAGSLAPFGYPNGSKLARSIEYLLTPPPPYPPATLTHLSDLITALQQELTNPPVAPPPPPLPPSSPSLHRVLIIDDDRALTDRLKSESDQWGYRLKIAPHPAAARSLLVRSRPDVVVLDLSFPAVAEDGLTLLQEITRRSPDLPVIVFTGRDNLSDRLAVSRLGARQFLPKPATVEDIFRAIERVIPPPPCGAEAKVLIVDDDPAIAEIFSMMLTPWGIAVTPLSQPEQFWQVLVATAPDLVLLDLEMPHISGLELCRVVRQDVQWQNLPILVVTAHTDVQALQQAFAAGADDFITKPVIGPELVSRVLSRIERTRLRQKLGNPISRI